MTAALIDHYDHVIFDLDGVLYLGDQAIPGAARAVAMLRDSGRSCAFATNNASKNRAAVAAKLTGLGITAEATEVVTAADVGLDLLIQQSPPPARVFVVGSDMLRALVEEANYQLADLTTEPADVDAVFQGFSPDITWHQLAHAAQAIQAGATWIGTNNDAAIPLPDGPAPGNGALIGAISAATGQYPPTAGKPGGAMFQAASRSNDPHRVLMVGDRLGTDILGANQLGIDTLNVLSGVTGEAELAAATLHERPMFIGRDVAAIHLPPTALGASLDDNKPLDADDVASGDPGLAALADRVRHVWKTRSPA